MAETSITFMAPSYDKLMDFFTDFRFQSTEAIMIIVLAAPLGAF